LLGPRRAGERFGEADLRVVRAMASQVEVAVRALNAADQLQVARDRLVRSREEERKRLRNDLHDGVGPTLAGIRMQVHALSRHDGEVWQQLDADLGVCTAEIARVIEGLRPPVLDDGLVHAVEREASRWSGSSIRVHVAMADLDPARPLPAAVEIAAYRIVAEAVSNAIRHGKAKDVTITLFDRHDVTSRALGVQVHDNGCGIVEPREGGVGLTSMRDRAEELGGSLTLTASPEHGTTVAAVLPIGRPEAAAAAG
jgi:signal transduction histidine kinase